MSDSKSDQLKRDRERIRRERAAMAETYRARLMLELTIDGSASQEWLIEAAVSAALEAAVLNARFLRCSANEQQMQRLSAARGQLSRILRLLLPKADQPRGGYSPRQAQQPRVMLAPNWKIEARAAREKAATAMAADPPDLRPLPDE